ncbi:hypothetical protein ColLi_11435 [Colletotrichum liriopes]|uniref:Uncharacterized protein n=1 Tax=Colletotrichum liriopes TaxID=708192 RepID=A0AA37GX12_9PEZI|nr:hypothetical protein ColLi_11435 [Colletotrichum liriopes]
MHAKGVAASPSFAVHSACLLPHGAGSYTLPCTTDRYTENTLDASTTCTTAACPDGELPALNHFCLLQVHDAVKSAPVVETMPPNSKADGEKAAVGLYGSSRRSSPRKATPIPESPEGSRNLPAEQRLGVVSDNSATHSPRAR